MGKQLPFEKQYNEEAKIDWKAINLTENKIKEPLNSHRVGENRYDIATYSQERPYLITYGLSACKALVFYNSTEKKGFIAHISVTGNLKDVIDRFIADLGNLTDADCYVVNGGRQAEGGQWPEVESLIVELSRYQPKSLSINRSGVDKPRGVALNLENGELSEIDNSSGWTWSDSQDVTINKRITN